MKKLILVLLIVLLFSSIFACSASEDPVAPDAIEAPIETEVPATTEAPEVIVFTDTYLEEAVRAAMNKPEGDITVDDAAAVTMLNLSNSDWDAMNAENGGIKDLSDLKYFINLKELNIDYNDIQDLAPLSTLTELQVLTFSAVRVKDLSPLASLTNMVFICFDWSYAPDQGFNGYENLDFVRGMKNLEIFEAKNAGIKDISGLVGLPNLWAVAITDNQITDITPLAQIKTLKEFQIGNNPITDYSVLEPMNEVFPSIPEDFQPDVPLK